MNTVAVWQTLQVVSQLVWETHCLCREMSLRSGLCSKHPIARTHVCKGQMNSSCLANAAYKADVRTAALQNKIFMDTLPVMCLCVLLPTLAVQTKTPETLPLRLVSHEGLVNCLDVLRARMPKIHQLHQL